MIGKPPQDAIDDVSKLLRISHLVKGGCSNDMFTSSELISAGQAIIALRYDYAIGDRDWYTVAKDGASVAKNPLRYAQSLRDEGYAQVGIRPKGAIFLVETDWKAEMASNEVDDPSIRDSGDNLNAVEVDYSKSVEVGPKQVYFYRTRAKAANVAKKLKEKAAADAKAAAEVKAAITAWKKKLISIGYLTGISDSGFKLIYEVCKDTGKKNADGL